MLKHSYYTLLKKIIIIKFNNKRDKDRTVYLDFIASPPSPSISADMTT